MSEENSPVLRLIDKTGRLLYREVGPFLYRKARGFLAIVRERANPRNIPLSIFLFFLLIIFARLALTLLFGYRPGQYVARYKIQMGFVNYFGFALFLVLLALCIFDGWYFIKRAYAGLRPIELWIVMPIMVLTSVYIGWSYFETSSFRHVMRFWNLGNYLPIVRANFIRIIPSTLIFLLIGRPWRFSGDKPVKIVSGSLGYLLLNYLIAFSAYMAYYRIEME